MLGQRAVNDEIDYYSPNNGENDSNECRENHIGNADYIHEVINIELVAEMVSKNTSKYIITYGITYNSEACRDYISFLVFIYSYNIIYIYIYIYQIF